MIRALAVLVALTVPAVSLAQSSAKEIDEVRDTARLHAGPFYVTPAFQLKEFGVDNNVFNEAGDRRSDFTLNFVPQANVWVPMARRALVKAAVASDLVWYSKYSGERSVDPHVDLRGSVYLERITLFAEGARRSSRQRPNQEIDLRVRHVASNVAAGAEVAVSPNLSLQLLARQATTRFDEDARYAGASLQRALDRDSGSVELSARRRLTPLTSIVVRSELQRDEFVYAPLRDADSYRVMPGIEFKPLALISGSAFVGYRKFTPSAAGSLPGFSGLVANLGLSYTLLGSTSFAVSFRRDVNYSYEELQPYFVEHAIGASVRRALGGRFDILVSADRYDYEYLDVVLADPLDGEERMDRTWNYSTSLGYRLGRDARVGFGLSYWQRESTTKQFRDYDNLRIGSTVSYGF
jgi:hypothetical protein